MGRLAGIGLLACGVVLVAVGWYSHSRSYAPPSNTVLIKMAADGKTCWVGEVNVSCSEVTTYLQRVLNLSSSAQVRFHAEKGASYKSVAALIEDLQAAGLVHSRMTVGEYRGTEK